MKSPRKRKITAEELLSDLGVEEVKYNPTEERIKSILNGTGGTKETFDKIVDSINSHFKGSMMAIIASIKLMKIMDEDAAARLMVEEVIGDIAKGGHKYQLAVLRGIMSMCYHSQSPLVQHVPSEARPLLEKYNPENSREYITDQKYSVYEDYTLTKVVQLSFCDMNMWQREIAFIGETGNPRELKNQKRVIERMNRDKEGGHLSNGKIYVVGGKYSAHDLIAKTVEVSTHRSAKHEISDTIELLENSIKKLKAHRTKLKKDGSI